MRFGLKKTRLMPTGKLQLVIRSNGTIGMVQRHQQVEPLKFSLEEVQLIAAFSRGEIKDLKRGLASYLKKSGLNDFQTAYCEKLVKRLNRLNRLEEVTPGGDDSGQAATFDGRAEDIPAGKLRLKTPCTFLPNKEGFQAVTHDGKLLPPISSEQLHALSQLVQHDELEAALAAHQAIAGSNALDMPGLVDVLKPFVAARFVTAVEANQGSMSGVELGAKILSGDSNERIATVFQAHALVQDAAEAEREAASGRRRPKVIPVTFDNAVPAGLGAIVASAKAYEDGALDEFYNFRTDWVWDPERLPVFTQEPAIYLFSNYLWSHEQCIKVSAQIKALSPNSITVHGGPDTPKYEGDEQRYFATYPHVDVTVRGEGEITGAEVLSRLRTVIGNENPDLEVLKGVEGATYRSGDGVARNPDRPRVKDLNELPSAYLTGLFDSYIGLDDLYVVMETNRGCPYGCTFCDWGSATTSKIRKFDEERVMTEIAWAAKAKVASVSIADANFGIFPRDVDFAREAARLKQETGFPRGFGGNYAKNTVKYLRNIIDVLAEGNILTLGTLSLQTMDETTLDVINRANIKTEKYDALAVEMSNAKLPLMIELMMGLPGSTVESFREDLQQCIDRELPVRVNMTTLLVNSPMNRPDYVEEHQISTSVPVAPGNLAMIASTASYTEEDLTYMTRLRDVYMLFENYGVLRLVARFVRQQTDVDEMLFYEKLLADAWTGNDWPLLHLLCNAVSSLMAPPVSWYLVMEEMGRYLESRYNIADSAARRSVLAAQCASLPAHDRLYPEEVSLECDVSTWYQSILAEKEQGNRRTWTTMVPRLESFSEAALTVDDPHNITATALGIEREVNVFGVNWELESPLHRARADLA